MQPEPVWMLTFSGPLHPLQGSSSAPALSPRPTASPTPTRWRSSSYLQIMLVVRVMRPTTQTSTIPAPPGAQPVPGHADIATFVESTSPPQPKHPTDDWDEEIGMWVGQTRWAASQVVAAHVQLGKVLTQAKRSLPHGQFSRLLDNPHMPFGVRQSQKLVKLATHPAIADASNHWRLPMAVDTLSLLAAVSPGDLRRGMAKSEVNYRMTISDAKRFSFRHADPYDVRHFRRGRRWSGQMPHTAETR